jgi:Kdo2-lipid IVA lauroyltransferase/acyltransferase
LKKQGHFQFVLYRIEYIILLALHAIFRAMPEKVIYQIAGTLGLFAFHVVRIRRKVTLENLWNAFGREKSEKEIKILAASVYKNIAVNFVEMLIFDRFLGHLRERVDMTEAPVIERTFSLGHGVILISAHFGSWEMCGAVVGESGYPATVVAKKQSNPYVDAYINRNRTGTGMHIISHGAPIKHIIRAQRSGEVIGLISDQDAGKSGVFVTFFGRPASTPRGAAELALKFGIPMFVMVTPRTGPGRYKALLRDVAVFPNDTVETLTQRFTTILEDIIRTCPEQYFWMHRRWKTQPFGQSSSETKDSGKIEETE